MTRPVLYTYLVHLLSRDLTAARLKAYRFFVLSLFSTGGSSSPFYMPCESPRSLSHIPPPPQVGSSQSHVLGVCVSISDVRVCVHARSWVSPHLWIFWSWKKYTAHTIFVWMQWHDEIFCAWLVDCLILELCSWNTNLLLLTSLGYYDGRSFHTSLDTLTVGLPFEVCELRSMRLKNSLFLKQIIWFHSWIRRVWWALAWWKKYFIRTCRVVDISGCDWNGFPRQGNA